MPPSIDLKALTPIVQGMAYARTLQGRGPGGVAPTAASPTPLLSSDTLAATISPGQGLPSLFSPAVTWVNAPLAQVLLQVTAAQSAQLSIDAPYLLEVFASRGSDGPYPLVAAYLPVLPSAGTQAAPTLPDLVTLPYATQLLGQLALTEAQLEAIPTLVTSAGAAIRNYCNRLFVNGNRPIVEDLMVELDGYVRLSEIPVNRVLRVQADPRVAISIQNTSAASAWVNRISTGDQYSGIVVTGIALNAITSGPAVEADITYADGMTIAQLAAAINGVGNGWTATADDVLGALPVTELIDTLEAPGADANSQPYPGATYHAYSRNVTGAHPHPDGGELTGLWYSGRSRFAGGSGALGAAAWGGWGSYGGYGSAYQDGNPGYDRVRFTYMGGFASVPPEIQSTTVELVKYQLQRLGTDLLLSSETAGEYSYTLAAADIMALPKWCLQVLARYRVTNS